MGNVRLGFTALAAASLLMAVSHGTASAMGAQPLALSRMTSALVLDAAQDGVRFHRGKRAQALYCLRQNYWWFYRPYTTAPQDYARCEPYFHYLEPANGRRGARAAPYFK